jgi:hypothetical protein
MGKNDEKLINASDKRIEALRELSSRIESEAPKNFWPGIVTSVNDAWDDFTVVEDFSERRSQVSGASPSES